MKSIYIVFGGCLAGCCFGWITSQSLESKPSAETSAQYERVSRNRHTSDEPTTVEQNLAIIEAGEWVDRDDPNTIRIGALLDDLSSSLREDRTKIADQTVRVQELLKEKGASESMVSIMSSIKSNRAVGDLNIRYAEYAAAYLILRTGQ